MKNRMTELALFYLVIIFSPTFVMYERDGKGTVTMKISISEALACVKKGYQVGEKRLRR